MAQSSPSDLALHNQDARSHRYEVDENSAFSPPHSNTNMFQIFDSSEIFTKHPRKYDLLNVPSANDDSSVKTTSTKIVRPRARPTRSLAVLGDRSSEEFQKLLTEHKNHPAMGPPATQKVDEAKTDAAVPRRRSSVSVMERSLSQPTGSPLPSAQPAAPSKTDQDVGGLSKMFRAAFGTGPQRRTGSNLPGYLPEEDEKQDVKPEFPSVPSEDCEFVPVTVVPEPRRLFGFGPEYQPPTETVMMPKDQAKAYSSGSPAAAGGGSLVNRVKMAGITAVDSPSPPAPTGGKQRKFGSILKPPTGEEMNTWAPFST